MTIQEDRRALWRDVYTDRPAQDADFAVKEFDQRFGEPEALHYAAWVLDDGALDSLPLEKLKALAARVESAVLRRDS